LPARAHDTVTLSASGLEHDGLAAGGGLPAADRLYAEHAGRVRAYLRRCGFGPADVDDLAQEVFLRAHKSRDTFDAARGTAGQWLAAIARNAARRRWDRASPATFDPALAEAALADPAADSIADSAAQRHEEIQALRQCIAALPPDLARIISLRYVDGRTTRAIAETERMAEATVRLRLSEAKAVLERCLRSKGVW
jgi:RNA polymerase sigma-70 factor (ECF subfamily)